MVQFQTTVKQPESAKERIFIDIPFNLWEEFHCKGAMEGKVTINGTTIDMVHLIPRGNGHFGFFFTKAIQMKTNTGFSKPLEILIEYATKEDKPCPAKEEPTIQYHPKNIQYIPQNSFHTCGQACIAMLVHISVEEVCKTMHTSLGTSMGQLMEALDFYCIRHAPKTIRLSMKNSVLPPLCILTVHIKEYTHWVLYNNGTYFDPEYGIYEKEYTVGKITSYLEIY